MQLQEAKKFSKTGNLGISSRYASIRFALNGLRLLMREPNAQIHAIATVLVALAGIWRQLSPMHWLALAVVVSMVWAAEAINTAVEYLCDYACGGKYHPIIKKVKDISAGAVLVTAVTSIVAGAIIFIF